MILLAFTGKMGVGKSTATQLILESTFPVFVVKFAGPLYRLQNVIYDFMGLPEPVKDRKLLQFLGTDWARSMNENIWVDMWEKEVKEIAEEFPNAVVVCDDCRFPNEAARVKEMGGYVIELKGESRGDFINNTSHSSETEMDKIMPDCIINNTGSKEVLKKMILDFLKDLDKEIV